jgi:hypothetical protein
MKTKIINTPQGQIVKIDQNLSNFDAAFRRAEKKIGTLHLLGYEGECSVFCDQWHEKHFDKMLRESKWHPVPMARKIQSRASKMLVALAREMGMSPSSLSPGWVQAVAKKFNVPKALLRYALSPNDYTAPEIAPRLP